MDTCDVFPGPVDILIAEDDALVRQTLRSLLERKGYRCAEAENGRQAVELSQRNLPRCVLLDLAMPEMDGLTAARQLRADARTAGIRLHCLTGLADPDARARAEEAGFEAFLTKPVDVAQLLEVVCRQVQRPGPEEVSGLTKAAAEDLLDRLENAGCTDLEVLCQEGGFTVRYRQPPASPP
jgi:CheY-like chemotaxis protein